MTTTEVMIIQEETRLILRYDIQSENHFIITHSKLQLLHHMMQIWLQNSVAIDTFPDCPDITW